MILHVYYQHLHVLDMRPHVSICNYMYHMHYMQSIYVTHVLCLHLYVSYMRLHVLILISNYMHYIRTYMYYMHTQLNAQLMELHVYYLCDMRTCITFAHTRIIHLLYIHLDALHNTSRYSYQYTITCSA